MPFGGYGGGRPSYGGRMPPGRPTSPSHARVPQTPPGASGRSRGNEPYGRLAPGEMMGHPMLSPGGRNRDMDWIPPMAVTLCIRLGLAAGAVLCVYGAYLLSSTGGAGSSGGTPAAPLASTYNPNAGRFGGGGLRPGPPPPWGPPPQPQLPPVIPAVPTPTRPSGPRPTPPRIPEVPPLRSLPPGSTEMVITNNEFSDGVVFCRGPVEGSMGKVFLDAAMTKTVVRSEFDVADPNSPAAQNYGAGVPGGTTLAFGLRKGQSVVLYIAPDGGWPSGACWYQDFASNQHKSIAKGPQYMSEVEFTIEKDGQGAVWYDMSSVEGVSGGITMNYTDDKGNRQTDVAVPGRFQGDKLKVVPAPGIGFPTVLSDKNTLGSCSCDEWNIDSEQCNSDACFAGCPGALVDNPCGQHRCRKFYAKLYEDPSSYCGWLYAAKAQTYCWAMDEWQCVDESCGYGGADQPAADCSSTMPEGAAANTYSCGHGTNLPSADPEAEWWTRGPGCVDKMVEGVPTNPAPPRHGGRIHISFENLPWLHELAGQM